MSACSPADHATARVVDEAMDRFAATQPALPLAVALSGGADSTALLRASVERWPGQVEAMHVHHGLQSAADDFERHCVALCSSLGVPLHVRRVDARHAAGQSPEAVARDFRYEAFDALTGSDGRAAAARTVLIAQHADDQVETILLALSRGAGLRGLSAMPATWRRGAIAYARPLLEVPGAAIRVWLKIRGQSWVEDPTNASEQYTRNRIRARLLPVIEAAFPQFRTTFARSAAHAAQAQQVLDEVAAQDLITAGSPPRIRVVQTFSRARQANMLRHWLWTAHAVTPSSAQLNELLDQIAACTTRGHRMHLKAGAGFIHREGDSIAWHPHKGPRDANEPTEPGGLLE